MVHILLELVEFRPTPGHLTPKRCFVAAAPSKEITQVTNATQLLTQPCPAHQAKLQKYRATQEKNGQIYHGHVSPRLNKLVSLKLYFSHYGPWQTSS